MFRLLVQFGFFRLQTHRESFLHSSSATNTNMSAKSDDPRMGSILQVGDEGDVVLLGYACDEGVRRNGGRVGAAGGPAAVRK